MQVAQAALPATLMFRLVGIDSYCCYCVSSGLVIVNHTTLANSSIVLLSTMYSVIPRPSLGATYKRRYGASVTRDATSTTLPLRCILPVNHALGVSVWAEQKVDGPTMALNYGDRGRLKIASLMFLLPVGDELREPSGRHFSLGCKLQFVMW